ncbi:MAG: GcrA family cell cycle regulator [Methylocella sp.]
MERQKLGQLLSPDQIGALQALQARSNQFKAIGDLDERRLIPLSESWLPGAFAQPADLAGVPLLALESDQCRWPLWESMAEADQERLFCGAPKAPFSCSYCLAHRTLAYQPSRQ